MKPIKKIIASALALLLLASMAGCTTQPGIKPSASPAQTDTPAAPVLAKPLSMPALEAAKPLPTPDYNAANASGVGTGANDFAFRLSAALSKKGENMVLSPFSVWMTLAALANATDENALEQLLKSLDLDGVSVQDINDSVAQMLFTLTNNEGSEVHDPLAIANAVFVDNTVTLNKEFAQTFLDYYRGAAMNVDFTNGDAIKAINDWASEHTNGLITDIVKELPPDALAAIANAIYFSDRWVLEFDEGKTEDMTFHGAASDVQAPFMLREGDGIPYYEDDKLQAVNLQFKTGAVLTILLPRDGDADALLSGLTAGRFAAILDGMSEQTGKLLLPRFEVNSDFELTDALTSLGVPLFDSANPPITGLADGEDLFISSSLHQATIKVDEKGTTAAAVTVQIMSRTSLTLPTEPFSMIADRPFVFVLHQWTPDAGAQVLFTGVVNQL